jgi:glycosyltransferase involved in cell wall biosynthesis
LSQTYPHIEIIVVDDNHPDTEYRSKTERQMLRYKENDNVVYLKNGKNLGGALARNKGIEHATGDYITFLDDDDIYLPDKVHIQLAKMQRENLDLCFMDVRIHNTLDKLVDYREHSYVRNTSNEELLRQHLVHNLTPTATYMFQTRKLRDIGGFDDVQVGQEFVLMLKSIERGLKIGYIPEAHVIQYVHNGERISVGQVKLDKEIDLYRLKKTYFMRLTHGQRKFVTFRHYVVMAIAAKRSRRFDIFIKHIFLSFVNSPAIFFVELFGHARRIRRYKNVNAGKKMFM